jgi:glucose-6-phosphate dehydrogenase assembly protein OpcA
VTVALSPEDILRDLHALWASLARESDAAEPHGVLRACAMTVIVLTEEPAGVADTAQTLAQVMRDHPNRAVVVRVSAAPLDYHVTAQCWMPFGQHRQICCEQIEIAAAEASLPDAVPVLLAIAAPDLPVAVWCRSPRLAGLDALAALFARADIVLVDSRDFADARAALELLARESTRNRGRLADLAWAAVTRWREIVAEIFEDPARRELIPRLRHLRVLHSAGAVPSTAYYLAAWILAALGRQDVEVRFEAVAPAGGGIEGIVLGSESETVSIHRVEGTAILIEIGSLRSCTAAPRLDEAELLGSELSITGPDAVFEQVLPIAARLADSSSERK